VRSATGLCLQYSRFAPSVNERNGPMLKFRHFIAVPYELRYAFAEFQEDLKCWRDQRKIWLTNNLVRAFATQCGGACPPMVESAPTGSGLSVLSIENLSPIDDREMCGLLSVLNEPSQVRSRDWSDLNSICKG